MNDPFGFEEDIHDRAEAWAKAFIAWTKKLLGFLLITILLFWVPVAGYIYVISRAQEWGYGYALGFWIGCIIVWKIYMMTLRRIVGIFLRTIEFFEERWYKRQRDAAFAKLKADTDLLNGFREDQSDH